MPPSMAYHLSIRCSRGIRTTTPPTKTKMTVGRTSAPSRRSSPTTTRTAKAGPRTRWERRGWTSWTAKWATSGSTTARATASRGRWVMNQSIVTVRVCGSEGVLLWLGAEKIGPTCIQHFGGTETRLYRTYGLLSKLSKSGSLVWSTCGYSVMKMP